MEPSSAGIALATWENVNAVRHVGSLLRRARDPFGGAVPQCRRGERPIEGRNDGTEERAVVAGGTGRIPRCPEALGVLGSAMDSIVGHRVAEVSVHRFVTDVAAYLRTTIAPVAAR
jgi:hypothetical protein